MTMQAKTRAPFKRGTWKPGDIYAIPLVDGSFGRAQAIVATPRYTKLVNIAVFEGRFVDLQSVVVAVKRDGVVALLGAPRSEMNGGWWARVGNASPVVEAAEFPNIQLGDGVGQTFHNGRAISDFVSAAHGLLPWNSNAIEDWYDRMLAPGVGRPKAARLLNALELETIREKRPLQ